ncbi:putative ATP:guanido phosphotransferase PAV_2c00 860 [Mycobacterium sp. PO1]|nr:putative ATP:guanido phosphotransferase PAV_2c00 860 [Mycobacterium sp. PO1]GFM23248.1 putative ATP:guanido phosphotransferase PAV_2c00 860 [Mycobacterium sp. PO2]
MTLRAASSIAAWVWRPRAVGNGDRATVPMYLALLVDRQLNLMLDSVFRGGYPAGTRDGEATA